MSFPASDQLQETIIATGFLAFEDGFTPEKSPHPKNSAAHGLWLVGWSSAWAEYKRSNVLASGAFWGSYSATHGQSSFLSPSKTQVANCGIWPCFTAKAR